eukprot:3091941-Pyramimonas_sp.AAC.1
MRSPRPVNRVVALQGAPPKAPLAVFACGFPTQYSSSWPHGELHQRPHWWCSHAVSLTSKARRGAIGSSTEGPSGGVPRGFPHPVQ